MFTTIIIVFFMPAAVVNSVVVNFFRGRALWEGRELPSRTLGWVAFCTANIVADVPIAIVSAAVYWLVWYFPAGFPATASVSGYVFLMNMVWGLFMASWGQWIAALAPSYSIISNVSLGRVWPRHTSNLPLQRIRLA